MGNIYIFQSVLRPFQDNFSSYETGQSVGGAKKGEPREKTPDTPASRTLLVSHVAIGGLEPTPDTAVRWIICSDAFRQMFLFLFQAVNHFDDASAGGLDGAMAKMTSADPDFGAFSLVPSHGKTNDLHRRKQRRRSASQ